jgi:quercetin dioxygenase-like cupin family protein
MSVEQTQQGPSVTRASDRTPWDVAGHTYTGLAHSEEMFIWETYDEMGAFVRMHVHRSHEEYVYVLAGEVEWDLGGQKHHATAGTLVVTPRGVPHAYRATSEEPLRMLAWITPADGLRETFQQMDKMPDTEITPAIAAVNSVGGVDFLDVVSDDGVG